MIHLIVRWPLPYQQTLCRVLNRSYGKEFTAWFAEQGSSEFPFKSEGSTDFQARYLSKEGYWKLYRSLRRDPEAIVILGGWHSSMAFLTLIITSILRVPVFIWADHPHPRQRPRIVELSRKLYLRILNRLMAGFLACGQPTLEHLVSLGIDRKKIAVFAYWTEIPDRWTIPEGSRGSDDRPLQLIAVGRHVPVKRFDIAIKAVALANERTGRTIAKLALAGDGPERRSLEALAHSLNCSDCVTFLGWLENEDVYREIENSDLLVLTSTFEGYGAVVIEAMASGRPILASEGVVAALDRDEGTGAVMLHPVGNIDCIARQITELAMNRKRLYKASLAARAIAVKWPPERAVDILDNAFSRTESGQRLLMQRKHFEGLKSESN